MRGPVWWAVKGGGHNIKEWGAREGPLWWGVGTKGDVMGLRWNRRGYTICPGCGRGGVRGHIVQLVERTVLAQGTLLVPDQC